MQYSLTYTGIIIFVVGYLFSLTNVPFVKENLQTTIEFIITFAGVLTAIYGRYRKGDLTLFGNRK